MDDLFGAHADAHHDAGGKSRIPWPAGSKVDVVWGGPRREFRYTLSEIWRPGGALAMWLMMNPSIADMRFCDPTLRRTGEFARGWNEDLGDGDGPVYARFGMTKPFGGQLVANIHAYRATDKNELAGVPDPVGPDNDRHILSLARAADIVILAYGQPPGPPNGALRRRGPQVAAMLEQAGIPLHYLRLAKDGTPVHPLYLPGWTIPQPWAQR